MIENHSFSSSTEWREQWYAVIIEPHDWMLPCEVISRTLPQAIAQHPFEPYMRGENTIAARV